MSCVELNCETDFVAKGDKFVAVADAIAAARRRHQARPTSTRCSPPRSRPARPSRRSWTRPTPPSARRSCWTASPSSPSGYVASYLHRTSPDLPPQVGVLVELDKDERPGRQGRRAAHRRLRAEVPHPRRVPAETVENERRVAEATAREEGKPEAALPKIVEGRVNGFFKENVLLEQAFAKDNKKTVQKVLDEAGVTLKRFARFRVGV